MRLGTQHNQISGEIIMRLEHNINNVIQRDNKNEMVTYVSFKELYMSLQDVYIYES